MVYYYVVAATTGTDGITTAAVPVNVSWVGQPFTDRTYFIKTLVQLTGTAIPVPDRFIQECQRRGLVIADVQGRWAIGGNT